jgi:hypothetical protein
VTTKTMWVIAPIATTAVVSSALAVVVDLATQSKTNWWAWVGVVALTVISIPVSLWQYQRSTRADSALGAEDAQVGDNIYIHTKNGGVAATRIENMHQHYYGIFAPRSMAPDNPVLSTTKTPLLHSRLIRWRVLLTSAIVVLLAVSAIVTFRLSGAAVEHPLATGLEPANGLVRSQCMQVTAHNVRVFTDPQSAQTWTTWTTGTKFWADTDTSALHRYRTTLSNGSQGWITANPHWITTASNCT